jgi:TetR/AcrR family transcriptional repressor of nem operon
MTRHKQFDQEEALLKAMEVFWSRGYEAASIQDLVGHMGISRQSLYDTYGDKHALYLLALDRYHEVESRRLIELLERHGSVKKSLTQLFGEVVEKALCDREHRGCFMGNATSELAGRCKETASRTCSNMATMEDAFYRALLRAKQEGEIPGVSDPRAMARFFYCMLQGLVLMGKARQDRKALNDVVSVTLAVLD